MQKTLKLDATQNRNLRFLLLFVMGLVFMLAFQFVSIENRLSEELTCEEITIEQHSLVNNG